MNIAVKAERICFMNMLAKAEKIRINGNRNIHYHAKQLLEAVKYGRGHNLFHGDIFRGNPNDEYLALVSELAAGILELLIGKREEVGPIIGLPRDKKLDFCQRALKKSRCTFRILQAVAL